MLKIYEDEHFFIRDDNASGIILDDEKQRYSLFYKHEGYQDYRRVTVFLGNEESAIKQLKDDYVELLYLSRLPEKLKKLGI